MLHKSHRRNASEPYKKLVDACINIAPISEIKEIIPDMVEIVKNFNVKYLKVAFITKHTRYWLQKNFGDNALPIYDTIMATNVMRKKGLDIEHLEEYWEGWLIRLIVRRLVLLNWKDSYLSIFTTNKCKKYWKIKDDFIPLYSH